MGRAQGILILEIPYLILIQSRYKRGCLTEHCAVMEVFCICAVQFGGH